MMIQIMLHKARWLNLGAGTGRCLLEPPWENFDRDVDLTKPLPFPDGCAEFIHAEHVIEHLPWDAGLRLMRECFRVLEPGGVLRIAFPDIFRFCDESDWENEGSVDARISGYLAFLKEQREPCESFTDIARYIFTKNNHLCAWTEVLASAALHVAGFPEVTIFQHGESSTLVLARADRHHLISPVAEFETTALEAIKP